MSTLHDALRNKHHQLVFLFEMSALSLLKKRQIKSRLWQDNLSGLFKQFNDMKNDANEGDCFLIKRDQGHVMGTYESSLDIIHKNKNKIHKKYKAKQNIVIKDTFLNWRNLYGLCIGDLMELTLTLLGVVSVSRVCGRSCSFLKHANFMDEMLWYHSHFQKNWQNRSIDRVRC